MSKIFLMTFQPVWRIYCKGFLSRQRGLFCASLLLSLPRRRRDNSVMLVITPQTNHPDQTRTTTSIHGHSEHRRTRLAPGALSIPADYATGRGPRATGPSPSPARLSGRGALTGFASRGALPPDSERASTADYPARHHEDADLGPGVVAAQAPTRTRRPPQHPAAGRRQRATGPSPALHRLSGRDTLGGAREVAPGSVCRQRATGPSPALHRLSGRDTLGGAREVAPGSVCRLQQGSLVDRARARGAAAGSVRRLCHGQDARCLRA